MRVAVVVARELPGADPRRPGGPPDLAPLHRPGHAGDGAALPPAALAPLHNRLVALLSILFRGLFALFFLFASGLLWLPALYEAVLAALQGVSYRRGWRADLMAKP